VGHVDEVHWGQVLVTPHAYGVVEVQDNDRQARQVGIQILTELTHRLSLGVLSLEDLENIAWSIYSKKIVTAAMLVPVGKIAYLVACGSGLVYLKRGDKLATLIAGNGAISGELQKGDTLLLVSCGFTQAVSKTSLVSVFDHLPPRDVAERLTILLHEKTDIPGAVALVFQVADFISDEEQEAYENKRVNDTGSTSNSTRVFAEGRIDLVLKKLIRFDLNRIYLFLNRLKSGQKKRSFMGLLAFAAAGLFIGSVILGIWKQAQNASNRAVTNAIADARIAYEEGTALLDLNSIKGRERLAEARNILEPYLEKTSEKSSTGRELRKLHNEIMSNLTQALRIFKVTPELYYDISLLKKGAIASVIDLESDTLAVLDRQATSVYTVEITAQSGQMVGSGGDLVGALNLTISRNSVYVEADKGIVMVSAMDKKPTLVIKKPENWVVPSEIVMFGGNLYVLDTGASKIWKYIGSGGSSGGAGQTFSDTREYLSPDSLVDLSQAVSMTIDGSIWIATSQGRIIKFTQGKEDSFVPKGIEPQLGLSLRLYTGDILNNLYVLDMQQKRVVVLDKSGLYIAQYVWDATMGISDFVVSETQKTLLLLSEGKIYRVAIQ